MFKFLSVLCLTASLMSLLTASEIIFKGLTVPQYDDKQKLSSLLRSEEAVYKGRFTHLNGIRLEIYDDNILKVNSPAGVYDSEAAKVYGKGEIKVEDSEMKITGSKWEVDIENSELKIFTNLKIELTKKEVEK